MALTANQALPWLIDVDVFEQAVAQTNWNTISAATAMLLNGYKTTTGAQNDEISFDVVLAAGTWTVEVLFQRNTNRGIASVQFDGVEKGTIDFYGAQTENERDSVTGIAVATSAKVRLKLKMATNNVSSSSFWGTILHIQLRRTA